MLEICPSLSLFGFEIQKNHFHNAQARLKSFAHATVLNLGWDETEGEDVPIGGKGASAGLFDPKGQRGFSLQSDTATTVSLSEWTRKTSVDQVLYVVIDTEGHEPKVLRGMQLKNIENQRKFPLFQYELGGTWAENDNRHNDKWTQQTAARHLEDCGYQLFLIGTKEWLSIDANFFDEIGNPALTNEGYGNFVQGNVLALHSRFTPGPLKEQILRHVRTIGSTDSVNNAIA